MVRRILFACLASALILGAQEAPFAVPPELKIFARKVTQTQEGVHAKASAMLRAVFSPSAEGGLGITYDNDHTRTIEEVWRDRKANCLSLTALFVAACQSVGIEARFGESLRISRWRRVGNTIRYERHVVALLSTGSFADQLVADFLPEMRHGAQMVVPLTFTRVQALFYSNRAVELMEDLRPKEAAFEAYQSIQVDPSSSVGWNVLGVVQQGQGQMKEAEASFRKALQTDPQDGAACGNLENLLRLEGRDREAQVYRERSLEVRKRDPFFNAFLAQEALTNQDLKEAGKRIRMAIRLLPQEPEFHLIQARVCLAEDRPKAALKALEQARKWAVPEERARYDSKIALLKGQGN